MGRLSASFLSGFCLPSIFSTFVLAQTSCSSSITPSYSPPIVAPGYSAQIIASGLKSPRGLIFDSQGHLLLVEPGKGLTALTLKDDGGNCVSVSSKTTFISDYTLNHAIELSPDGNTLYASTSDKVFSWSYDAKAAKNTSVAKTLVQGMDNPDHTSRTLLASKKVPGLLLVSRGSQANIDYIAEDIHSGHSQIRSFNVTKPSKIYDYASDGELIGWGLRNSVGVAEDPTVGGIWSVENSVDNIVRETKDIHENNPGEEMNFHGYLNGTAKELHGKNFGYPLCYAVWETPEIPDGQNLQVGMQFMMGSQNSTDNDTTCADTTVPPRITFPSHWAPLDIKFNSKGTVAYITSHGSWNKDAPDGYLLYAVKFNNGQPTEPSNSTKAAIPILSNKDNALCPNGCFRPVGLAWDSKGRLFMTSDRTGEIFVIGKSDGSSVDSMTLDGLTTSGGSHPSTTPNVSARMDVPWGLLTAGYAVLWVFTLTFGAFASRVMML